MTAGTVYRIAVDGFGSTTGTVGLQWSTDPPANDDFAAPEIVGGCAGTTSATTVRATGEPGELDYHGGAAADNSAWFSWTPTDSGPATLELTNVAGGLSPGIGVYTGTSLGAFTPVGHGATSVSLTVVAGTTYMIAVDGNGGSTGTFDLEWDPVPDCALIVTKAGTGSGAVTASGIDCGSDCSQSYPDGTAVVLEATADPGSIFSGWSGCDTVSDGACLVTMGSTADRTVVATFDQSASLSVGVGGSGGTGTVSGPGISCGDDCSEAYAMGTAVTLSAAPVGGSTLTGWDGCEAITAGGSECVITMDADRTVLALFDPPVVAGPGPGSVSPPQTTITGLKLKKEATEGQGEGQIRGLRRSGRAHLRLPPRPPQVQTLHLAKEVQDSPRQAHGQGHRDRRDRRQGPDAGKDALQASEEVGDGSVDVEAIQIHHLVPRSDEVARELLLPVVGGVDLREGSEL